MRRYEVILERVMVPYHQRDLARTIAMQVLDARLGGPQGVVDAYQACVAITGADARWAVPDTASRADCAAVKRWRRATEAALDAIEHGFAHVFVGMEREDIELARADEHLSILPHANDLPMPARMLSEARVGLPWTATAAVVVSAAAQAAMVTQAPMVSHAAAFAR
ncbi:hypothetical protein CDN99_14690 [Roseateles aquatilis]|uniref:Uncharacterized protein n=1 Tax=Roseateles aquatilis TaxID=431061 RepID=A0A246J867_9BURK|nr:hypothetical protein [Roseateles aquatilis]OWQ88730.1 hypothetical protein CDN99_14690 [Roseateles aquatilis]